MTKKYFSAFDCVGIDTCDYCGGTQDVTICDVCGQDICCWCKEHENVYSKDGGHYTSICEECAKSLGLVSDSEEE